MPPEPVRAGRVAPPVPGAARRLPERAREPDADEPDGPGPWADQRDRLELLVALTRDALAALDAAADGDVETLRALEARRRRVALALADGAPDDGCAGLAREARSLDARLLAGASRVRDALGAKVRDLHAIERARRGYADTDSLGTDDAPG